MKSYITTLFMLLSIISYGQEYNQTKETLQDPKLVDNILELITHRNSKFSSVFYPTGGFSEQEGLSIGVMPVVTFNEKEASIQKPSKYNRPTTLIPSLSLSTKGLFNLDASLIMFGKGKFNMYFTGVYQYVPNTYFGINEEVPVDTTSYFNRRFSTFGEVSYELTETLFLGLHYDIQNNTIEEVESVPHLYETSEGIAGGFNFGLGPILKFDTRDDIVYPSQGSLLVTSLTTYPKLLGNDYVFWHFYTEFSHFVKIKNEKNILGFFGAFHMKNGQIPFYYLNTLGGSKKMRSIAQPNRFIDKNYYMAQVEYRRHLWWRVGVATFASVGNVYGSNGTNAFENMKYTVGLGLRFQLVENMKLNFRIDYGIGNYDQQGLWLTSREAF
ncbi:BamA/TamA family outer membrane protein [Flammeovirga aprica]|uniref:BamA/TamA family outer membrane protein n=1 Tax=Flammeovirga aprica JL-4 TaxID=694437 RepID=A0A7X9XCY1_9BACT|nr:BamA/TamA family outer membrane protein [Flammeovirga aprica]NME72208.1 BamA/TamA family outer membrane protein [Flammeovirga aprica JL-4]